jgi:hypothetical protein
VINDFEKLKLRNLSQIIKDGKPWNGLVQKTQRHVRLWFQEEGEEKEEMLLIKCAFGRTKGQDFMW